jgi:glycosyltransferase involved in cell wall biosynthesis
MREISLYATMKRHRGRRKLILFPSYPAVGGGGSSDLRAWGVARSLERLGWQCAVVPAQLEQRQRMRIIGLEKPDMALVQQGRHKLNRPQLLGTLPYLFDIDDADYLVNDQAEMYAELCSRAEAVTAGSHRIASWCSRYNRKVEVVWTGVPFPASFPERSPARRRPILAWTHHFLPEADSDQRYILSQLIRRVKEQTDFELWLFGIQKREGLESTARLCDELGIPLRTWPFLKYPKLCGLLESVAVGIDIIPKDHEVYQAKNFGKVLAFMRSGVSVVVGNEAEYPQVIKTGFNGFLADSYEEYAGYIAELLKRPDLREYIARNAWESLRRDLSLDAAAAKIDALLRSAMG